MPLVSIVMPVHNTRQFIEHAVKSVLDQTFADFELLIVDDGSTDGSRELVEALARRDERIRFRVLNIRSGCAAARNAALAMMSDSRLVAFLDADDAWYPQFLQYHVERLLTSEPECVGSFCWSTLICEQGSSIGSIRASLCERYDLTAFMTALNPGGNGSCFVVKREFLDGAGHFDCSLTRGEDTDLWLRVLLSCPQAYFRCIPRELTYYRKWQRSASAVFVSAAQLESMEQRRQKYLAFIPMVHQARTLLLYLNIILSHRGAVSLAQGKSRAILEIWAREIRGILGIKALTMRGGARALLIAMVGLGPWLVWKPFKAPFKRGKLLLRRTMSQFVGH